MGIYGTPEHLPEGEDQKPAKKRKWGIVYTDLKIWQKVLLTIYGMVIGLFAIIMFVSLIDYTGSVAIGIISAVVFLACGALFIAKISSHKRAWPFIVCSCLAFVVYFSAMDSSAAPPATTKTAAVVVSSMSESSDAPQSVASTKNKVSSEPPITDGAIKVDYKTLYKDYEDNAISADKKYREKKLVLTGAIANIDRDIAQSPYITFNVDEYGAKSIKMSFDNDDTVAALKKGQKVTVVGTCGGTFASTIVVMSNCSIIK
jgi:hypothetical protein